MIGKDELQDDLRIDPENLDIECLEQAEKYIKWAERYAEASSDKDRSSFALEVGEARLSKKIRNNPEEFGLTKVTEGGIKEAVHASVAYQELREELIEARESAMVLQAAASSMEQRKRMLEILVTLHGQKYFASPNENRDLVSAYKELQNERMQKVQDKQKALVQKRKKTLRKTMRKARKDD